MIKSRPFRLDKYLFLWVFGSGFLLLTASGYLFAAEEGRKSGELISSEDFVRSDAARFYQDEKYEDALGALDGLLRIYPGDSLLLRYRAMTLDRLNRTQEAIEVFKQLLAEDPQHAPTRYFLGEAYEKKGDFNAAAQEWRWVKEHSPGFPYGEWALEGLQRVEISKAPLKPERRRFQITGRYGYEYDSNVTLKPEDKAFASSGDQNAGRQILDLVTRYRAFSRRDLAVDLRYAVRQSFHDDGLDEFNFHSEEFGLEVRRITNLLGQRVTFGARYDFLLGFLDDDLFSLRNRTTLSADTKWNAWTRSVLSYEITPADFGPDGSNPPQTSRDGLYQNLGLTQYFYWNRDPRKYLFIKEEYNRADVRGGNFELRGSTTRAGIHTPLFWDTDLDVSGGYQFGSYPRFSSLSTLDTDRRQDHEWDLYVSATHYIKPWLGVRAFYRFIDVENDNGFFEYDRHIGGVQIIFSEWF